MKNFKKVLALVLAIATLLSFATVASAKTADFADAKDVKNVEAVDVLSSINVLEGYPADKSFKPAKNITREEAAKIIAIFANKSTDISSLYTSANPFADMKGRWGESYVAYGYRAGIIAGKNATSFVPKANVKGTEFLKMVLVVLGYDQNKEGLVGSSWAVNTLELAKLKGLMNGLDNFDANAALTRDQAAQIMLNALKAEKVVYGQTITNLVWNAKLGYWTVGNTTTAAAAVYVSPNGAQNNYAHELLAKDFNLTLTDNADAWGRPTHIWKKGTATIGEYVDSDKLVKSYTTAVTECDIAKDAGISTSKNYTLYVNGNKSTDVVRATATSNVMGAQGRLTEVYTDRIVMIDTFLAVVTNVTEVKYDAAGHKVNDATIDLTVYSGETNTSGKYVATSQNVQLSQDANFGYAVGDYVLVNAYTEGATRTASTTLKTGAAQYAEIAGKAESFEGAQTVIWYNAGKHTVEGTTYDDAMKFFLGNKDNTSAAKFTWFKDAYGNLIGAVQVASVYSYGVVTKMYWELGTAGTGAAKAEVTYMDGTTNTVTVAKVEDKPTAYSYNNTFFGLSGNYFYVTVDSTVNAKEDNKGPEDFIHGHLMKIATLADGSVTLAKVTEEVSPATVISKYPMINTVKIDSNTKFLYREADADHSVEKTTGLTYKTCTGMNEMPSFKAGAKVDYVLNASGVAEYVYIIGDTTDSTTKNFVYINSKAYSSPLKTNGGIAYYEITLPVPAEDGSVATLKVKNDTDGQNVLTTLTNITNVGKLFYVTYTNEYATAVTEITATPFKYEGEESNARAALFTEAKMSNGAIDAKLGGTAVRLNVTGATTVIGELKADMTDKALYVIYTGNNNNIEKVYVSDYAAPTQPDYATISLNVNVKSDKAVVAGDYVPTVTLTATYTDAKGTHDATSALTYTVEYYNKATGETVTYIPAGATSGTYGVRVTITGIANGYTLAAAPNYNTAAMTPSTIANSWIANAL